MAKNQQSTRETPAVPHDVYPVKTSPGIQPMETTAADCFVLTDSVSDKGVCLRVLPSPVAVENKLNTMYGLLGWGCRRYNCGGTLYCSVGVYNPLTNDYLHKDAAALSDYCGVATTDKAKASDASAFVHAAAHWGVCQDVLALPNIKFDSTQVEIIPVPNPRDPNRIAGYRLRPALTVDKFARAEDGTIVAVQLRDQNGKAYTWQAD